VPTVINTMISPYGQRKSQVRDRMGAIQRQVKGQPTDRYRCCIFPFGVAPQEFGWLTKKDAAAKL